MNDAVWNNDPTEAEIKLYDALIVVLIEKNTEENTVKWAKHAVQTRRKLLGRV